MREPDDTILRVAGKRKWTDEDLKRAVKKATSLRQTLKLLKLVPAGGNYVQLQSYISKLKINTSHFKGKAWNKGMTGLGAFRYSLEKILVLDNGYQSFKLKARLFREGIKKPECEICGWAKKALDGRLPLELDHINGDRRDNRLFNLRILCPNCHSLQETHRGRNKKRG